MCDTTATPSIETPFTCAQAADLFPSYEAGTLPKPESGRLFDHIIGCGKCYEGLWVPFNEARKAAQPKPLETGVSRLARLIEADELSREDLVHAIHEARDGGEITQQEGRDLIAKLRRGRWIERI